MREFAQVTVRSRAEWRAWLAANHTQSESIWLVRFKKGSGQGHVPYTEVVQEALCFGWVDSLPRKLDEKRSLLLVSPRRAGSAWSAVNKRHVEAMVEAGLMTPAGLAKVAQAKASGRWEALASVDRLEVSPDLETALKAVNGAKGNFEAFSKSSRRGILEWIGAAKRAETRARRVAETARLAGLGIRANHPEARGK